MRQRSGDIIIRGQRAIANALISLMKYKEFKKITVTEICQMAGVNRKTFYRNFETKEDILKYHLNELFIEYIQDKEGIQGTRNFIEHFLSFYREKHETMGLLMEKDLMMFTIEEFRKYGVQESMEADSGDAFWIGTFISAGLVKVYESWYEESFVTPLEKIVNAVVLLIPSIREE
ncbi:TetR/AcrR family transcriptional regulator [Faecalicatena sp. AGMB00832]|uniref:TetR/AcrR family transcriptional regulator n=1 Tax=Faecalicatena faecalis TaxID=2726362 RepID=A0ABS6D1I0_9FIRM|nr:TetR/AcrR family transcriptional regulator [Faecalicatena faecalis]MBU3875051.1 TetR/AcrR family transcriptional regulator [Faecalicatena faecalis]